MKSRIYHYKLSDDDTKPKCALCDQQSMFYCNMNDLYYCDVHIVGHDENEVWYFNTCEFIRCVMNDSERNGIVLRIAAKIQQDGTPYDEQNQSVLEQYIKYAVSLGVPESEAPEIVGESFLYLQMQESPNEDPLQKGDKFGVGFS